MCGRVNVYDHKGIQSLLTEIGLNYWPEFPPRYNIAPSSKLDVLISNDGQLAHETMVWGVLPKWARPGQFRAPLINARAETIHEKASFKNLVKQQRLLLPVNGFYEWKRFDGNKTSHYIRDTRHETMLLAGIFQHTSNGLSQCCLITKQANAEMTEIHDRMPVIIEPQDAVSWLSPLDKLAVDTLLFADLTIKLQVTQVSDYVNNTRHDGPQCMQAIA